MTSLLGLCWSEINRSYRIPSVSVITLTKLNFDRENDLI